MNVVSKLKVSISDRRVPPIVDAVQGDSARLIIFELYDGSVKWYPPENSKVVIRYSHDNGTSGIYDTLPDGNLAYSVHDNFVEVSIATAVLAAAGDANIQVAIIEGDNVVSSFPLVIRVYPDVSVLHIKKENYINISNWAQDEIERIGEEIRSQLDDYVSEINKNFSYVAVDDGNGNVTIKPFHLGGLTDKTLSVDGAPADAAKVGQVLNEKAPAGYGLGGSFSRVYSWEDIDTLKTSGLYVVDAGPVPGIPLNGEQVDGPQVVRVEGSTEFGGRITQTMISTGTHPTLCRQCGSTSNSWSAWTSEHPGLIAGRNYLTDELFELNHVRVVAIDLGVVHAGETVSRRIMEDTTEDFSIIGINRLVKQAGDNFPEIFYTNISGLEECVEKNVSSSTGDIEYSYFIKVKNSTDKDLKFRYTIKYTDWAWDY